jgi:hypothetical protein
MIFIHDFHPINTNMKKEITNVRRNALGLGKAALGWHDLRIATDAEVQKAESFTHSFY